MAIASTGRLSAGTRRESQILVESPEPGEHAHQHPTHPHPGK